MTYFQKLKDPRWQKKRLEILQRDDFKCKNCNADDKELHVHHNYYTYGLELWEYDDECYDTLCYDCHYKITEITKEIKEILKLSKSKRLAEIRNILVMQHHLSQEELIEIRNQLVNFLISKGFTVE